MIRYTLLCPQEHSFDSWFRDSDAYAALAGDGQVACPSCGSTEVRKALMTPSVVTSRRKGKRPAPATAPPEVPPPQAPGPAVLIDDKARQLRAMVRDLHRQITENADDVGRAFATEARAIHEKAAPARSIYGEASRDEVRALIEDGVPLLPMPVLPDDHH